MNIYVAGLIAGLTAGVVWVIANLLVDAAFLPVISRHTDQLNEKIMSKPSVTFLVLVLDIAFWGALFGLIYPLVYPAFKPLGALVGGLMWGFIMYISFVRGMLESILFTKVPRELNVFWFVEAMALIVWGAAFGLVFNWLI